MALIALSILVDTLVHLLTYPVALLSLLHLCDVDVVRLDEWLLVQLALVLW